jgi:type VI secretion system protein ImpE
VATDPASGGMAETWSLQTELARIQDAVRREPAKAAHRSALAQLHCIAGAWDKASRQLALLADLDPEAQLFCTHGRLLLACEAERTEVLGGRTAPSCLGEPPKWMALLTEALRLDGADKHAPSKELRDQAFALATATAGQVDGTPFAWIADADERLGPVLEASVNGRYLWIPFDRLRRIASEGPKDLKDLVWLPVTLTLANEGEVAAFVPTRYPGSEAVDDDAVRLARRTEWGQLDGGSWVGLGQRMLASDAGDHPLLDIRTIELRPGAGHG